MMIIKNKKAALILGVLSVFLIILGIVNYVNNNKITSSKSELGSCATPEQAYRETQKALNLLSTNINSGIESAQHIKEYEITKNKVFKNEK
ncbi:MAG: hypothetical protein V4670_02935 [Bacteroidota bacterium]